MKICNVCIVAHVDHGKTTLTDCLLSSNGIISEKLTGIRFMDNRKDEQERGITIKSSSISITFVFNLEDYRINIIDTPGHIDFTSEVSTASRLCDGGLLVVDSVEGVCSQTITVLKQAYDENVVMILVINKIDRLITELKMTPQEAHLHMQRLVEQVNAVLGSFEAQELLESRPKHSRQPYFTPLSGNVIFASAIDGWAFRLSQFSSILSQKLGMNESVLNMVLWGSYYYDPKAKKISKKPVNKKQLPLCVQFVLAPVWQLYEAVLSRSLC
jgi:ribosome assembly protein 1